MKKLLLFAAIWIIPIISFGQSPQYATLSTILSWFEHADTPTESQFATAWANSYNAVADGVFDLSGFPSISVTPYTALQVGKFSSILTFPHDTTVRLNWNGTLAVSNLWVNGVKYTGTGSSIWSLNGNTVYLSDTSQRVAIGTEGAQGYGLYIDGTIRALTSMTTNVFNFENALGYAGSISIDASGNMQFTDENNTNVTLASILGSSAWAKTGDMVALSSLNDTVTIGAASGDSVFNVFGTSYFGSPIYADSTLNVNGTIITNRYLQTPSINFSYGATTGQIDLLSAGKLSFYDVDYPSGVALADLAKGYFEKSGSLIRPTNITDNLVIGATSANSSYDLTVAGASNLTGNVNIGSGVTMTYGSRIQFTNGYISNGTSGLVLSDAFAGTKTLTEILGVVRDSMSIKLINTDTVYFNGSYTKKIYSPGNNNIYAKIGNAEWRFENFNGSTAQQGILYSDVFQFKSLINDTMQGFSGFRSAGRAYLSQTDTNIVYATGKVNEWRVLATQDWVTNALLGAIGAAPTFDTIWFDAYNYMTSSGTSSVKLASLSPGTTTMVLNTQNTGSGLTWGGLNAGVIATSTFLKFSAQSSDFFYNGTYWYSPSDTLATQAYARAHGSGGAGTPGGASGTIQYNNSSSFGGFWSYNGTNIVPTAATGLAWSASSFIKGNTVDSINLGKMLSIVNSYTSETDVKNNAKSIQNYVGGYLTSLSNVYVNYNDANANNGLAYGVYSHLYSDENYAATGNTSYSNAGRFILQNNGTTTIGGGTPGSVFLNGLYGEITGAFNVDAVPGTYILTAIYGKDSHTGGATGYAGYFDGALLTTGTFTGNGVFTLGDNGDVGSVNTSDWDISTSGALTGISGITNDNAFTTSGGAVNINASSNFAVNLATGTSTGAISIGGGSNTVAINSTSWDISTAGAFTGVTTMSMSGQLTSTLPTGTSPFSVASTTVNTNLNADLLDGQTGSYYQTATNITTGTLPGDRGVTSGSSSSSFIEYNGTTATAGQWDGGTTNPTGTIRLNYNGYQYATRFYGDFYIPAYSALTDTFALVLYPGGKVDTAMTAFANEGWEAPLQDWDQWFGKSQELKALPMVNPMGKEMRKPNPVYSDYQFEYTLETLARYFNEEVQKNKKLAARIEELEMKLNSENDPE